MSATVLPTSSLKLSTSSSSHHQLPLSSAPCLKFPRNAMVARTTVVCNSISPTDPVGENKSKNVLDAFFLGKALAEVVNERVESTIGEFLSTMGRIQAKNQQDVQEFQEEVVERAKRARENATQEAMAPQGLIPKASPVEAPTSPRNSTIPSGNNGSSTSDGTDPLVAMMIED